MNDIQQECEQEWIIKHKQAASEMLTWARQQGLTMAEIESVEESLVRMREEGLALIRTKVALAMIQAASDLQS